MGATNRTQNYNLPQFVGSDKPTWLGDFNGAMSSIDSQMKINADSATSADTKADTALTNAQNAQTTANTAQTTASEASTTATSALNKALSNEQGINNMFNFTDFKDVTIADVTLDGITVSSVPLSIAKTSDEKLFKIYGAVGISNFTKTGTVSITINNVFNNVPNAYGVDSVGINFWQGNNSEMRRVFMNVNLNGSITLSFTVNRQDGALLLLFPCLYINQDFGD